MFKPGDIVIPRLRHGAERLFLWSENSPSIVVEEIEKNTILTIIRIESFNDKHTHVQDEWKKGSCLLLAPTGVTGWTGVGWVKKLPSSS
jgi:hypothetical protein